VSRAWRVLGSTASALFVSQLVMKRRRFFPVAGSRGTDQKTVASFIHKWLAVRCAAIITATSRWSWFCAPSLAIVAPVKVVAAWLAAALQRVSHAEINALVETGETSASFDFCWRFTAPSGAVWCDFVSAFADHPLCLICSDTIVLPFHQTN